MTTRFKRYLQPTLPKIVIWFAFLLFYLISSLAYIGILPNSWYRFFYTQISSASKPLGSSGNGGYSFTGSSSPVDSTTLFLAYILLTYLFSCIFVESFGTISPSRKRLGR